MLDPYRRYRHAKLIHAVRVSLGLLATILLTTGISLPHGEWASVTMLVVIGGLQHHGNIGKKAAERAIGTLIGAGVGLLLVAQHAWLGMPWLTYFAMSVVCGFFSYHAIGKGGYTALLSAITVFIVAGHGDNPVTDGLWRGVDILIGIALALAFSFALPLYAVYSWRYNLADALRDCAAIYGRIIKGESVTADEHLKLMNRLNTVMIQLRSLMPSVSKEVRVSMTELDAIQRNLRMCVSILEILGNSRPNADDAEAMAHLQSALKAEHRQIRVQLIGMARALKSGASQRLSRPAESPSDSTLDASVYSPLDAYRLLTRQLTANIGEMRQRLAKTAPRWNI
ncbi:MULTISPECIES: FUSC family protein [unclassified Pseudomonas]|uniref:FUSC family protein n=1 Tax=unclassified Pseudomonas TaxID=196821 RepID=UPI0019116850|nr:MULTISPECIES: FUSC family protein [unclassified Pseudomonas]MBK5313250.1 FUSC family protein [Pseudomonas sp. TH71]MBK5372454.1 FUSC family protein [Pseudomonas sp. TH40]MBK5383623.1 FUSC family protein [Pseudomonas sp. TH35]MBK5389082.1 FUSC family protein [Pseudomonas sp. TH38]MBK5406377.1 FUSC family protein [Pseudomonas sp. TH37]